MIKFVRRFRDADEKEKVSGLGKLYMPLERVRFSESKELRLVKLGLAVKIDEDSKKETKNLAPDSDSGIEKKTKKK